MNCFIKTFFKTFFCNFPKQEIIEYVVVYTLKDVLVQNFGTKNYKPEFYVGNFLMPKYRQKSAQKMLMKLIKGRTTLP